MDRYDPATVFSSIDAAGRYAYGQQPAIAQWNLARLAEALLPLFDPNQARAIELANASIARFETRFQHHWLTGMRAKLGLLTEEPEDVALADGLLTWMQGTGADFTNTFARLSTPGPAAATADSDTAFAVWHAQWQTRRTRQPQAAAAVTDAMRRRNPAVIPRNHLVEAALTAATDDGDLALLERLMAALAAPYDHTRDPAEFGHGPAAGARPYRTFCGT